MRGAEWAPVFAERMPDRPYRIRPEYGDPEEIRCLAAWQPPGNPPGLFPDLEILFSLGAGADQFDLAPLPSGLPVVRMVERGVATTMVEYVALAVLALHRDLPADLVQQHAASWRQIRVRLASERRVVILGLGRLAQAAPGALGHLGFQRLAWSRTRRAVPGAVSWAGATALAPFLARCDILACLLPLTAETRGMSDRHMFDGPPRGAGFVNVGRGGHLVAPGSVRGTRRRATVGGRIGCRLSRAVADRTGDLAPPRILLMPHIASMTQPPAATEAVIAGLQQQRRGEPMEGLVDRARG